LSLPLDKYTYYLRCLFDIVASRRDRWERLCENVGQPEVPEGFVLYRGVNSREMVRATVRAWEVAPDEMMRIPQSGLSSWSLLEGDDARNGARHHFLKHSDSVLLKVRVPLERTFLDVLVDDGFFAHKLAREAEVIVGDGDVNLQIQGIPREFRVRLGSQEYGIERLEEAKEAMKEPGSRLF
jgi:hypothetical protein